MDFVSAEFHHLNFVLEFNPHGDVWNIDISDIEIEDIYALTVGDQSVRAEAEVRVHFTADFSYEDLDTGFYDKETDSRYMTNYVEGQADEISILSIYFDFRVENGKSVVSDLSLSDLTVRVTEEDRGDYGQWK